MTATQSVAGSVNSAEERRLQRRDDRRFKLWHKVVGALCLALGGVATGGYVGTRTATPTEPTPETMAERQRISDEHLKSIIYDAIKPMTQQIVTVQDRIADVEKRYEYLFRKAELMQSVLNAIQGELMPDVKALSKQVGEIAVQVGRIDERTRKQQ